MINDDLIIQSAMHKAHIETSITAYVCSTPRSALTVLSELGVTRNDFDQLDLIAIVASVRLRLNQGREAQACTAKRILKALDFWDETDTRTFISGSRWSDTKLVALFMTLTYDETRLRMFVAELRLIQSETSKLAADLARKAAA